MAPRTATPKTAPISRLVLVADAAMPERSGRTTVRGVDVTGTSAIPNPMPAMGNTHPSVEKSTWGPSTALVHKMPAAASTQPMVIGIRGPTLATHGPVNAEATMSPAAIGMKSTAVW